MTFDNISPSNSPMTPSRICERDDSMSPMFGQLKSRKPIIGLSGLIGAGKTTLAKAIGQVLDLPVYKEPVEDNEYLADFYNDMSKYGFPMQIYLLNRRFEQYQEIVWSGKGAVQDRTMYEDAVFCRILADGGNIEKRDYHTYLRLFKNMSTFMRHPDFIVHLDVSPEETML
ncbi:hypothetical protein KIPB_012534, partial [Kipferlia bialata]|eukprot:g12534.t1